MIKKLYGFEWRSVFSFLVILLSFIFFYFKFINAGIGDPDRFYHIAISKITYENGLIRSLPQAEDIGWGAYFPDKEFLFHQMTTLGYRLFGEKGVVFIPAFVGSLILAVLFFMCRSVAPKTAWIVAPLLIVSLLIFSQNYFIRLHLVRPHLLGILFTLLIAFGVVKKNRLTVFLSSLFFSLSYHAIYVPLAVILCSLFVLEKTEFKKILIAGVLGLFVGILINPYFPSNLVMMWVHFKIALIMTHIQPIRFGAELIPLRSDQLVIGFIGLFVILGVSFLIQLLKPIQDKKFYYFFVMTFLFTGLMTLSPRAKEYAVPFAVVLFCILFEAVNQFKTRLIKFTLVIVLVGLSIKSSLEVKKLSDVKKSQESIPELISSTILDIPEKNSKIFQCNWHDGSYILYKRPDLKFIDLLDPSFLLIQNEDKYQLRESFLNLEVIHPRKLMSEVFHAKYVLCDFSDVNDRLEFDPDFIRVFPKEYNPNHKNEYRLYEVRQEEIPHYLKKFKISYLKKQKKTSSLIRMPIDQSVLTDSEFIDFHKLEKNLPKESKEDDQEESCFLIVPQLQPQNDELTRKHSIKFLAFQGGPEVQFRLNQKPFFYAHNLYNNNFSGQYLFEFPNPFQSQDYLEIKVCGKKSDLVFGGRVSLWSMEELDKLCQLKNYEKVEVTKRNYLSWNQLGSAFNSCLGKYVLFK